MRFALMRNYQTLQLVFWAEKLRLVMCMTDAGTVSSVRRLAHSLRFVYRARASSIREAHM